MSRCEPLKSNKRAALAFLISLLTWQSPRQAAADFVWDDNFQIHGFLTQGYVNTTSNSFFGDSEDGSFDFRELGVNASYRFNPQLMASAQLLSRKAGDMYDGSLDVDYAQLDYTPYVSEQGRFGAILGRFKNPLGFYNDTRDVAATRPSIFLPQVIYWDRVRNMVLSNDGGMLHGDMHSGLHSVYLNLFTGKTPIDENVENSYLPPITDPDMDQDGYTKGGRLLYEWDGGVFRLAFSGARLKLDGRMKQFPFPPPDGSVQTGTIDIDFWIASAQYNRGPLSLTLEYMNEPLNFSGFSGFLDEQDTTLDGYYLQGNYRLSSDWEVLLRYEGANFDKDNTETSDANTNQFVRMWTLGLLWEPIEKLMLRAEFSRVDGTIFLSNLENDPLNTERNWNMFALLASYSF